jgi:hypothetical protein
MHREIKENPATTNISVLNRTHSGLRVAVFSRRETSCESPKPNLRELNSRKERFGNGRFWREALVCQGDVG